MPKFRFSLRARILRYLRWQARIVPSRGYERFATNVEMSKALRAPASQVSSITNKLYKAGRVSRVGANPYEYYLSFNG